MQVGNLGLLWSDKDTRSVHKTYVRSSGIIRALKRDGWYVHNVRGSHHQFRHPTKPGEVSSCGSQGPWLRLRGFGPGLAWMFLRRHDDRGGPGECSRGCSFYRAGPTRKVPARKGMSYTEENWVNEETTLHRGPDDW